MALNLMKDLFCKMFARMHKLRISIDLDDISFSQLIIMGQQFASNSIDKSAPQLTHSPPLVATVPLETIDAKQSHIALMAEGYPIEPFDTTWMTLDTAWREWHEGLGTGEWKRDSIEALERKFGNKWRYNSRLRMWHSQRKRLIAYIDRRIAQGEDREIVIAELQGTGGSIDSIRKQLEKRELI